MTKTFIAIIGALFILVGANTSIFAKNQAMFRVRIENISNAEGLVTADGSKYPFALSPGMFAISDRSMDLFKPGHLASEGIERQAEDGNPEILVKKLTTKVGSINLGIFNTPVGAEKPAPILPGGAYEFTFGATEGMKLSFITMYGQSNDLFYAPEKAIELFGDGKALSGDITDKLVLWDAGTEVNEAPGIGANQAPRQKMPNSGTSEKAKVKRVMDGFSYPDAKSVIRVTISRI